MSKWKLVPVEATDEMIRAIDGLICSSYLWPVYAYRAMIDAAPVPAADDCESVCDAYAAENQQFSDELARLRAENERLTAAGAAICQMKPVVEAAQEWSCERPVSDWADAALLKVLATFEGDRTEPCEGCDGECGEPCQPCTVAEMHAGIDRQTAALVEAGKLLQGTPLDAIYAEADRLGCRLPSGDSPEGYSITLSLKNLRTEG